MPMNLARIIAAGKSGASGDETPLEHRAGGIRGWRGSCFAALGSLALGLILPHAAQAQVLIKEVISRETVVHVGATTPQDIQEIVSREATIFVESGLAGQQAVSREVSLVIATSAAPPPVTGYTVTPSPTGDSVTLDWANYNPWAVGDVARFEIYISDSPFTDVTGLTPVRTVGGETVTTTIGGLTAFHDHFIAIVAVDVLGNRIVTVINSAAYIISPQVISREVSLFNGGEPPYLGPPLLSRSSAASILVPTDGSLGNSWQQRAFTPAGWLAGSTGTGFGVQPGIGVRVVQQNAALYGGMGNLATVDALLAAPPGSNRISREYFAVLPTLNLLGDGGEGHYANSTAVALNDRSNYAVHATGFVRIPIAGAYTFGLNSDDGGRIKIDGVAGMTDDSNHGPQDHLGTVTLTAGLHAFDVVMWEGGGGDEVEFYAAPGALTAWSGAFALVGDTGAGGLESLTSLFRAGDSASLIQTDIEAQMRGVNASVFVRQEFNVTNAASLASLALRIYYADGFVAYVNGTEVARRNAPASPAFNSTATAKRATDQAVLPEIIDLTPFTGLLVNGTNVLAIQGLNDTANDGQFLLVPELFASTFAGGAIGYESLVSREVSLAVVTATPPPQVIGYTVTASPTGDSAILDWSAYNPWAVRTVAHFDIYVSDSPFTDVAGMTPARTVGGETVTATVTGLTPLQDHYFAIVAVDVLGNRITAVANSAAYVISPQVISREASLFIGAETATPYGQIVSREVSIIVPDAAVPAPVTGIGSGFTSVTSVTRYRALDLDWSTYNELLQNDVVRYRVYVDTGFFTDVTGVTPFAFVPAGTQKATITVPAGNQIYYSAIVAEDALGHFNPIVASVSAQSSATELWIPNQDSVTYGGVVLPDGGTIRAAGIFQVDATVAPAIVRVDFSYRPAGGANVLLASDTTPADGFTAAWNAGAFPDGAYVFTFRAFDNVGRFTELTRSVTLRFNYPPVITAMTLDGVPFANNATITRSGRLGAMATDSDGIGLAEFFHRQVGAPTRTPLGTDSTAGDGLDVPLSIEPLADGAYDLIVRVFDSLGTSSETTRRVNLLLAAPAAPLITAPADGARVISPAVTVTGTAAPGSQVFILLGGTEVAGPLNPSAAGAFTANITLQPGSNTLTARAMNRAGPGPQSAPRTISLNTGPVITAMKFDGVAIADGAVIPRSGRVGVAATDSDGIQRAEFFYKPPLSVFSTPTGTDTNPADGLDALWQVESLADGPFDLVVRVYDNLGTFSELTRRVNLALVAPSAPAITSPLNGPTVTTATVDVRGTAAVGATLRLYRNGTVVFTGTPAADGTFILQAPLVEGVNAIFAQSGNRAGDSAPSNTITVTRRQALPVLTIALPQGTIPEGGTLNGTVSMDRTLAQNLTVALGVSEAGRLTFPASVVIPAGQTSVPFTVQSVQNNNVEPQVSVTLIASAPAATAGTFALPIMDDDTPAILLTLDRSSVNESAGPNAVFGTLTLDRAATSALTATFSASAAGQIVLPQSVAIPSNVQAVTVPIGIVDNAVVDGNRTVAITAHLFSGATPLGNAPPVNLTITDDESPSLSLSFDRTLLIEGRNPAATATISIKPVPAAPVVITLTPSNAAKLLVPMTVTIPAGQGSTTFPVGAANDGVPTGTQTVGLDATAVGYNPASATLRMTDVQKPDLTVHLISPPTGAVTDSWVDVRILLQNQGAADAQGPFTQRILLATDSTGSDGILLTQADFAGRLIAGGFIEQSLRVRMPRDAGRYWLVAQTDANLAVDEVLEDNNTAVSDTSLDLEPAYTTTLFIVPTTAATGTAIPITGTATLHGGGAAAFVLVNIHITNQGTERVISALTNSIGQFSANFTPLPGQGGLFQFGASHPGVTTAPVQDEVRVYGLKADPATLEITLAESGSQTGTITIRNLADLPVSGLTASTAGVPPGITFTPTFAATGIAASGTVALNFSIAATSTLDRTVFTLSVQSAQGAAVDVPVAITVAANVPRLVADPAQLFAGMLRGGQQVVNFTLKNDGRAPTAPVNLLLPAGVGWIHATTALPIPSLAPGASVPLSIQLTPPADLTLGDHTGSIVATDGVTSLTIPFRFRALSDQSGQLIVRAEDEYTYYAAGNPPLAGAIVKVTDAVTGTIVGTMTTGASGAADFGLIREGFYNVEVNADRHAGFAGTVLVEGGNVNEARAFLSRQTVTYAWTVVPTQIEDHYKITIDTTFETVVPIPVVTVEPTVIDLAEITANETVVNVKVTNHGLIAANGTHFSFPTHPLWSFTPAIDDVGTLPAMSSITVPVTIRKLSSPGAGKAAASAAPAAPAPAACFISATVCWDLVCGKIKNTYCATLALSNANSGCGGPAPSPSGCTNCGGGGFGAGGTYQGAASLVKFVCDPECLILAGLGCIPGPIGCFYSGYSCGKGLADPATPLGLGIVDCAVGAAGCLFPPAAVPACIYAIMRCFIVPAGPGVAAFAAASVSGAASPAGATSNPITTFKPGLRVMLDVFNEITGAADGVWLNPLAGSATGDWYAQFQGAVAVASDGGRTITPAERASLIAVLPPGVPGTEVTRVLDRWNRTVTNAMRGIFRRSDTPAGESTDFVDSGVLRQQLVLASQYQTLAEAAGFTDPINAIVETARIREATGQGGGICARVKLRLEQDAVLTRDAFRATLELDNNGPSPLENLRVDVNIAPETGGAANSLFSVTVDRLSTLTAVNGTGILPGNSTGTARWLIIPTRDAAPQFSTRYLVGGTLSYRVDGTDVSVPLSSVAITVLPSPKLDLKYFHQRDVFSDDPFTLPVEPAIPYALAVLVQNSGAGTAHNFKITSAQPQIIENEKGLLIDFQIIATQVAGQSLQPSLTADFGDIAPGQIKIADWLMTSTLQGLFIDYSASFTHVDDRGNARLSLINSVEIHEMIHQVRALGTLDDGLPDFLVNDIPDARNLPDTIYLSDGTTAPVAVVENAMVTGALTPSQLAIGITATMPAGWTYLRIPEPSNGLYVLQRVIRSDGLELPLDVDAWVTDRTFIGQGRRPTYENILHLLDRDSTGQYTLIYQAKPAADTQAPMSHVTPLAAQSPLQFPVMWQGSDDYGVAFYDIHVSVNGGPFGVWLSHTRDTGALYTGELGKTYAFYSIATDAAGNAEAAPVSADASTAVTMQNIPPTLAVIPDQTVNEGDTLVVNPVADDPDGRKDLLQFAFTSAVPPGFTMNGQTGQIRWITGEADGGRTVAVNVAVTDSGTPAQSATRSFVIRVIEVNSAPTLADVPPQRVSPGSILSVQLHADDSDLPAQTLTYRFTSAPPAGMTINGATGLITWQTGPGDADRVLLVSVAATDSGTPPAEAQMSFPVTVEPLFVDRPPLFAATAGQIWLAGSTHTLAVNASDPDGDSVKLTLNTAGLPGGVTFASTEGTGLGQITWNTTGVAPGIYSLPVTATSRTLQATYSPAVKIVPNNPYWRWAAGALGGLSDFAKSDPLSDPDGDGNTNLFEWALLTNPLVSDTLPLQISREGPYEGGWIGVVLDFHRRKGSNQYVTFRPQISSLLQGWQDIPSPDWDVFLDPFGDRDGNAESEEVLIRIWLNSSDPDNAMKFFRVFWAKRPGGP